jgi:hypothetical protein
VIGSLPNWAKTSAPGNNFTLDRAGETENAREFSGMDFAELACRAAEGRMKIHPGLSSAIAASATTRVPPAQAARTRRKSRSCRSAVRKTGIGHRARTSPALGINIRICGYRRAFTCGNSDNARARSIARFIKLFAGRVSLRSEQHSAVTNQKIFDA